MRSRSLLTAAERRILREKGPASGQSSTVAITYELLDADNPSPAALASAQTDVSSQRLAAFRKLGGAAKAVFEALGGGESFLHEERNRFFGLEDR